MESAGARSERETELALCDQIGAAIFELFEAWPRVKDLVVDALRAEALGDAAGDAGRRGALMLRGPAKMLQTIALVTSKGKASTTADRFKAFASRCKWVPDEELAVALEGVSEGLEGLEERRREYVPANQFVVVLVFELASEIRCQHKTATGVASVDDRGPWHFVLDHGRTRTSERPGFGYNGSLVPYRVSPDRPVPDHIPKPDYYADGQPEAERRSDARNTPPVHNKREIEKMRQANRLGREILDAAHRIIRPGVTTDEIDRVVHEYTVKERAAWRGLLRRCSPGPTANRPAARACLPNPRPLCRT
jgi:hypothetical protein